MPKLTVSISQPQQRKDFFLLPLSPLLKQAPAGSLRRRRPGDPEPRAFPPTATAAAAAAAAAAATAGAAATATTAALPAQFFRRPLGAGVSRKRRRRGSAATAALWRRTGQRTSRATPRYGRRSPQSPSLGSRSPANTYEEERKRKEEEPLAVHRTFSTVFLSFRSAYYCV